MNAELRVRDTFNISFFLPSAVDAWRPTPKAGCRISFESLDMKRRAVARQRLSEKRSTIESWCLRDVRFRG